MFGFDLPHWPADTISVAVIVGWLDGALPALATLASLIYFLLQIYHDSSVQEWRQEWADHRRTKRLAHLLAHQLIAKAEIDALELKRHQAAHASAVADSVKATAAAIVATTAIPPSV